MSDPSSDTTEPEAEAPPTDWNEMAAGWDDHAAVRAYSDAALDSLLALLAERGRSLAEARVVDFGCGTGLLTERLLPQGVAHVTAIDAAPAMAAVLRQKAADQGWPPGQVEVHAADITQADHAALLPDGAFDLVLASSVLAFVPALRPTVARLARCLAPGGLLVHWDWVLDPTDDEPYGLLPADARAALEAAGLVDVTVGTGFSVPFEGMTMAPLRGVGRQP